jgi:hypothetical protein
VGSAAGARGGYVEPDLRVQQLDVGGGSGWTVGKSDDTDLSATALGKARQTVASEIDAPVSNESARWRFTATGVPGDGQAIDSAPVETPLIVAAPTTLLPSIVVTATSTSLLAALDPGAGAHEYRVTARLAAVSFLQER